VKNRSSLRGKTSYLIVSLTIFLAGVVIAILSFARLIIFPHLTPIGLGIGLIGLIVMGMRSTANGPASRGKLMQVTQPAISETDVDRVTPAKTF
jgi:hypothetical protein